MRASNRSWAMRQAHLNADTYGKIYLVFCDTSGTWNLESPMDCRRQFSAMQGFGLNPAFVEPRPIPLQNYKGRHFYIGTDLNFIPFEILGRPEDINRGFLVQSVRGRERRRLHVTTLVTGKAINWE